jgi:hypothetical protein
MTTVTDVSLAVPAAPLSSRPDHRGSWIPTGAMIATRIMELRKRRGLMIALVAVNIGIPVVFLTIRLLTHAFDPTSYGPAGGYQIYTGLVARIMFIFGFIVAATLGCTAGSVDLSDGMFRHLVVTGRSRLALYLARIPAGLAIVVPIVAVGFTVVCAVCVFAAPTQVNYGGTNVPANLSRAGFESWAVDHAHEVMCDLPLENIGPSSPIGPVESAITCNNGPSGPGPHITKQPPGAHVVPPPQPSPAQLRNAARLVAQMDYADYSRQFLYPSNSLMIKSGLWLELEAAIGFIVGLGLASLLGQRTVAVVLMIVLEIILTPIVSTNIIPHLINAQRAVVGLATIHLEPASLPLPFGGNGPGGGRGVGQLVPESTTVAVCVIVAWLVGWTILGAWRMMTRDA